MKSYRKTLDNVMPKQPDLVSAPTKESQSPDGGSSHQAATKRKVIFASSGISNERQVQEVLTAGSSVALLYTALVYGGVGTISSIKDWLEGEMKRDSRDRGFEGTE